MISRLRTSALVFSLLSWTHHDVLLERFRILKPRILTVRMRVGMGFGLMVRTDQRRILLLVC